MEFDLRHLPVALLALVPALVNLALLIYIVARRRRNGTLYALAGLLAALFVWQMSDALVRLSARPQDARTWMDLLAFGSLLIGPFGLHFALLYTGRHRLAQSAGMLAFLYAPPLAFEMMARGGLTTQEVVDAGVWVWQSSTPSDGALTLLGLWVAGLAIAATAILARHAFARGPTDPTSRPALLLAIGFSLPVTQGTLTQVILPIAFGSSQAPVASTTMLAFSFAVVVAIRRHGLLDAPSMGERLSAAEERLEREHRLLSEAERSAHLGSWQWDLTTQTVEWTDEMYRIYGHEPQSFPVNFDRAVAQMLPEDRARMAADLDAKLARATAESHRTGARAVALSGSDYRIRRPDGETRWLHGQGSVLFDEAGRAARVVGTVLDTTRERAQDEERALAGAREAQIKQLSEMNEFKNRFINTAAHELNTPLTPIRLQIHLLKTIYLAQSSDPMTHQSMEILDRNVTRLAQLIQDVLDSTRLQTNRLVLHRQPTDLSTIAAEAVESFREPARLAGVELRADLAPSTPLDGDPLRLSQVVYNLLSNAVKFTPRGGRVTIETEPLEDHAVLRVADTGVGIASNDLDLLFQPFVQVARDAERPTPGTGLGLYIAHGIIEAHGGRIRAESPGPGRGTAFHVNLPTLAPLVPEIRIGPKPAPPPVIDLEERIRRLL